LLKFLRNSIGGTWPEPLRRRRAKEMTSGDLTSATVAIPRQNFAVRISVPDRQRAS
jgi:hypothetical protein